MRYSTIFGKTQKTAKTYDSVNATYLIKGGFINQTMAGGYSYLTLGLRVLAKIEAIIREEMDTISSEILMPSIVPTQLWQQTKRLDTVDVLMKTEPANAAAKEKNDSSYILSPTHEEVVTPLTKQFYQSYRDFPVSVYQIQTKFRNEPRAKSGLMRCREFRMKDMYSFHTSEESLKSYYEEAKAAYWRVYERLGIKDDTYLALASGGDFTDDYSHEYQTRCDTGEDILFHVESLNLTFNREVAPSQAPPLDQQDTDLKPREDVEGVEIIGVEALAAYLKIPVEQTTKTILFEDAQGKVVAAAVRGTYEIDTHKLEKVLGTTGLTLASPATVKRVTGAEVGYAGLLNLPDEVTIVMDESMKGRTNFEMGANTTNSHTINVNFGRDLPEPEQFYDIKVAQAGDRYPETGEEYQIITATEVGNIFPLYTKFTEAFEYTAAAEDGTEQTLYMGCYGIGSSRIMGVLVEKFHDEKGIIWPEQVAPYQVHLIALQLHEPEVKRRAEEIFETLTANRIEVLFDEREDVRPGEKFADADLIGIPWRLVVSKKTGDLIEVKRRTQTETSLSSLEDLITQLQPNA